MQTIPIGDRRFEEFISQQQIGQAIASMADRINTDYEGKNPLFIAVLNGSFMFAADLLKKISIPCQISFVKLASYQHMQTSGKVTEVFGLEENIGGRHVLVLEDIVDTGLTMETLLGQLSAQHPASVEVATLLFKPTSLQHKLNLAYVGFEIPDRFVVGYGLDYDGAGRNLPALYVLADEADQLDKDLPGKDFQPII